MMNLWLGITAFTKDSIWRDRKKNRNRLLKYILEYMMLVE